MSPTIREGWAARFQRDEAGLRLLLGTDPFKDWARNSMPEAAADGALSFACRILFANADETLATGFLSRCLQVCVRAMEGPGSAEEQNPRTQRLRLARILRARGHATALLAGEVDRVSLTQAAEQFAHVHEGISWDDQIEAYFLARVRLALILGCPELMPRARELKKRLRHHSDEYAVLLEVARHMERPEGGAGESVDLLRGRFDHLFDVLRDPQFRPDRFMELEITRLELGVIRCQFLGADCRGNVWRSAAGMVGT